MPTLIGVAFLLASLFCFFRKDDSLFAVVLLSSLFEASSVISSNTFGVQPYYAVTSLFILQMLYRKTCGYSLKARFNGKRWMILFAVVAMLSAAILPSVFAGMAVYNPYAGIDNGLQLSPPLQPSLANLTQSVYLLVDILLVIGVGGAAFRTHLPRKAYLFSFYFLAGIIFVQFLCSSLGLPFPYSVIQNHGGYSLQTVQAGTLASRMPGTFAESSQAGMVLTTFTAGFLAEKLTTGKGAIKVLIGVLAILLVRSTLSLVGLAVVFACLLISNPAFRFPYFVKLRILKRNSMLLLLAGLGCAVAFLSPLRTSILSMTAGKQESSSFINRMAADVYALQLFVRTNGLGVGMGSNRPSSLLTSLLSTVGIAGFVIFAIMVIALLKNAKGRDSWVRWAGFALILSMCFGIPDFIAPWLWVFLAFAVYVGKPSNAVQATARETNEVSTVCG